MSAALTDRRLGAAQRLGTKKMTQPGRPEGRGKTNSAHALMAAPKGHPARDNELMELLMDIHRRLLALDDKVSTAIARLEQSQGPFG